MNRAIEKLRVDHYSSVSLWVFTFNQRARRFYDAAGFQADGSTKDYKYEHSGQTFTLVEMRMIRSLISNERLERPEM